MFATEWHLATCWLPARPSSFCLPFARSCFHQYVESYRKVIVLPPVHYRWVTWEGGGHNEAIVEPSELLHCSHIELQHPLLLEGPLAERKCINVLYIRSYFSCYNSFEDKTNRATISPYEIYVLRSNQAQQVEITVQICLSNSKQWYFKKQGTES
jgi:hypothetical protein